MFKGKRMLTILLLCTFFSSCEAASTEKKDNLRTGSVKNGSEYSSVSGDGTIFLKNCRLIDGTGAEPAENVNITVEGGRIADISREDKSAPKEMFSVDLEGGTVLPGFINTHVHHAYNEANLKSWAGAGITTVRDLGPIGSFDVIEDRDKLNKDPYKSFIVSANPNMSVPGGYGFVSYTSPDDARDKVISYIKKGYDIVKFSIENNQMGRKWSMPTFEEVKSIVDTAHKNNKKASVHLTREVNLKWAVDIGVDDIAHMVVDPVDSDMVDEIVKKGIYWVPTLELWNGVSKMHSLNWIDTAVENLNKFYKAGGKIALGTDFDGYSFEFDKGFPITEVSLMKRAGMSNMDIIVAATKNAAFVCGLDNEIGTVEIGKKADLLIVHEDPLADINVLTDVEMVIHNGVIVSDK